MLINVIPTYPNLEVSLFLFLQQSPATTVKSTKFSALVLKIDLYSRSTGLRTTSRPPTSRPSATMASTPALPTPFSRCRAVRGENARTSHRRTETGDARAGVPGRGEFRLFQAMGGLDVLVSLPCLLPNYRMHTVLIIYLLSTTAGRRKSHRNGHRRHNRLQPRPAPIRRRRPRLPRDLASICAESHILTAQRAGALKFPFYSGVGYASELIEAMALGAQGFMSVVSPSHSPPPLGNSR